MAESQLHQACSAPQHILILNLENKSATTTKGNSEELHSPGKGSHLYTHAQNRSPSLTTCPPTPELWPFKIPAVTGRGEDCWDLFVDKSGTNTSVRAVSPSTLSQEGQFIGRLNLQQLGFWDRKKRRNGKLAQAYMIKQR